MTWQLQALSAGMSAIEAYNNAKLAKTQGKVDLALAKVQAGTMRADATRAENRGVRAAGMELKKGEKLYSDAIANMAAMGGGVDPLLMAEIKRTSDYNAMTAIYDARMEAINLRYDAAMVESSGRLAQSRADFEASQTMRQGFTSALSQWPKSPAQSYDTDYTGNKVRPKNYKPDINRMNDRRLR